MRDDGFKVSVRGIAGNHDCVNRIFFELAASGIQRKCGIHAAVKQVFGTVRNLGILFDGNFDVFLVILSRSCLSNFVVKVDSGSRSETADNTDLEGFRKFFPIGEAKVGNVGAHGIQNVVTLGLQSGRK